MPPSSDRLDRYGEAHGSVRDDQLPDYDERLEFRPFIMCKDVLADDPPSRALAKAVFATLENELGDIRC